MGFDFVEHTRITMQILTDISKVWNVRRVISARFDFEEGMSIEDIASKFKVKTKTAENYIKKFELFMGSDDVQTQYKFILAVETPDKHASPEALEKIRKYVIKSGIHKTDWFFVK